MYVRATGIVYVIACVIVLEMLRNGVRSSAC